MGAADARLRRGGALSAVSPITPDKDGALLAVRLTPRGGRDAIGGVIADADGRPLLQVRLSAPPVEGAANRALVAFLAGAFGLRTGDVSILSGEASRVKRLHLAGDAKQLAGRLADLLAAG